MKVQILSSPLKLRSGRSTGRATRLRTGVLGVQIPPGAEYRASSGTADALGSGPSGVAPHESSTLSLLTECGREQVQILTKLRLDIVQFGRMLPIMRSWRNWQTRYFERVVGEIPCRFKSGRPHQFNKGEDIKELVFFNS